MSCFEEQTVYYAINYTFGVVPNTTGKCDNTDACRQAYCELNRRRGVDWICFSASQANDIVNPLDVWQIVLYCVLVFLVVYSVLITFLYLRGEPRGVADPETLHLLG